MTVPARRDATETARRSPFAELDRLTEQLQSYLDGWTGFPTDGGFTPLADVEETDEAYLVEIELPGVKREDVTLEVAGPRLSVSGERKERERVGILRRRSRTVGRFHYEVVLPGEVEDQEVSATMDEGVLTVRVPKPASQRPRRIAIT